MSSEPPLPDAAAPVRVVEQAGGTVEIELPPEPGAARSARHYIRGRWGDLPPDALGDVELIVTELVSNAVRHGRPAIVLRLRFEPFAVDVAVLDHGPGRPVVADGDLARGASGRGLAIVDKLALRWGVDPLENETGKIVWASIDRT